MGLVGLPGGRHHPDVVSITGRTAPRQLGEDAPSIGCCYGEAVYGPTHCTCWEIVYDRPQAAPRLSGDETVQTKCCHDCAYRNGSPERAAGEGDDLDLLAGRLDAGIFYCHAGMRKAIGWRHPDGRTLPWAEGGDHYDCARLDGNAYRADGTPALVCAGWAAKRRAAVARGTA